MVVTKWGYISFQLGFCEMKKKSDAFFQLINNTFWSFISNILNSGLFQIVENQIYRTVNKCALKISVQGFLFNRPFRTGILC